MVTARRAAVVAGEASGDLLAGLLLQGMRRRWPELQSAGIGGPEMARHGFLPWWPYEKLAVRGNVVIIDHGMGVFSLMAHNSKLIAQVGQTVQKGDVVSLSGNTGLSNGPHLHWEVRVSGPPVDPLEWVNRAMP